MSLTGHNEVHKSFLESIIGGENNITKVFYRVVGYEISLLFARLGFNPSTREGNLYVV